MKKIKKNIYIITGSRAEYDLLKIWFLHQDSKMLQNYWSTHIKEIWKFLKTQII